MQQQIQWGNQPHQHERTMSQAKFHLQLAPLRSIMSQEGRTKAAQLLQRHVSGLRRGGPSVASVEGQRRLGSSRATQQAADATNALWWDHCRTSGFSGRRPATIKQTKRPTPHLVEPELSAQYLGGVWEAYMSDSVRGNLMSGHVELLDKRGVGVVD